MLLIKYLGNSGKDQASISRSRYEVLLGRGEDVTWYGGSIDVKDANAVLMQRKMPDGIYEITFADGHEEQVNSERLLELLTGTFGEKTK